MEYYLFVCIALIFVWIMYTYNKIVKISVKINESESGIDVALSRRYSILSKMHDITRRYMEHEKDLFSSIVKLRAKSLKSNLLSDKSLLDGELDNVKTKLAFVVEEYPELKSDKVVYELQESIIDVEDHLQAARRMFNSNTSIYNAYICSFPTVLFSNILGLKKKQYFRVEKSEKEIDNFG